MKIAALKSASRINGFGDVPTVARLVGDADPQVRRGAADLLGSMRSKDAVDGLMAIAKNDPNVQMFIWFVFHDSAGNPWQSGLYGTRAMPSSSAVSATPFS